jgi:hypothetical protein
MRHEMATETEAIHSLFKLLMAILMLVIRRYRGTYDGQQ